MTSDDPLNPWLYALIRHEVRRDPVFWTLGTEQMNQVTHVSKAGAHVVTHKSLSEGTGPQLIPAWMFNKAWAHLREKKVLPNKVLLEELNVKRSSGVCAILARLPGVRTSQKPITLHWEVEGDDG